MKSTNNLTPQPFWGKRKPLPHYFKHGYIDFSVMRIDHMLKYTIWKQDLESLSLLESDFVKDQAHLKQLLSIKSVDEIPFRNLEKMR